MRFTARLTCTVGLLALLLTGCDSGGDDLHILGPISLRAYFGVPEGGNVIESLSLTIPLTFDIEAEALRDGQTLDLAVEGTRSFSDALAEAGASWTAVQFVDAGSGTVTVSHPDRASFVFFESFQLDVEAGDRRVGVLNLTYPRNSEQLGFSLNEFRNGIDEVRDAPIGLRVRLRPNTNAERPAAGIFTFEVELRFTVEVGTAEPAPDRLVMTRAFPIRDQLRSRGVEVRDVEVARIGEVRLTVQPFRYPSSTVAFAERFEGLTIRLAVPGSEGEVVARLDAFERDRVTGAVTAIARSGVDVRGLVRRSSELEMHFEFDLNGAAAVRGEYYALDVVAELIVEVPVDALGSSQWP